MRDELQRAGFAVSGCTLVSVGRVSAIWMAVLVAAFAGSASAAAPHRDKPTIASFTAKPSTISASGGSVQLHAVVRHAAKCKFAAPGLAGFAKTKNCASGQVALTLDLPANTSRDQRTYLIALTVRSAAGASTKRSLHLLEAAPVAPKITTQPASTTVVAGQDATFTAKASGDPAPSVQWQSSTDGGASWSDVAAPTATAPTLTITANSSDNGNELRAVFTNSAGSATTAAVTLTVHSPPGITAQSGDESLSSGHSFVASASATGDPSVQWQVSTNSGGSWADLDSGVSTSVSGGVVSSQYSGYASALGTATEYRAIFTNAFGTTTTSPEVLTVTPAISPNWAGYVAFGETFTRVSGSWTVPTTTCDGDFTGSVEWVGIDGVNGDPTVEQDGTDSDCPFGNPDYVAWYEMNGDTQDDGEYGGQIDATDCAGNSSCPVAPGDAMSASVSVSGTTWTFTIDDTTAGWTFTSPPIDSPTPTPQQAYAEWIVSPPQSELTDFGAVPFSNATATVSGQAASPIADLRFQALEMEPPDQSQTVTPSSLTTDGEGFTDTWNGG